MLGGMLFSATMTSFALFAKKFGDSTLVHPRPAHHRLGSRRSGRAVHPARHRRLHPDLLHGLRRPTHRQPATPRRVPPHPELPIGYFDRNSSATLLSRLTYNTEQIGQATTDSIIVVVRTTLTIIGSLGFLLWLNWRLALVALILGPIVGWLVSVINRYFRRYSRRIQDSMGDVTRVAKESFEAPRLIKVYNAEGHVNRQFDAVNEHNLRSNMRLVLTRGVSNPIVQLVTALGAAFVLSIAIADAYTGA